MIDLLDLAPTAIKLAPNFYSANNLGPNINSYNQYYQHRLLSANRLKQKTHQQQHRVGNKHNRHSTSRLKKHQSRLSADQQSLLSKNRAKSSQTHGVKSHSHKSDLKKKHHTKKSPKQNFKIAQQYLSRVSQMVSEISMPSYTTKINFKQLNELENRIMSEILQLREEKISALEGLNEVVDGRNKAVEILRKLQVMREVERLNDGVDMMDEQQQHDDMIMKVLDNSSSMSKASYLQGRTPLNRLIKSPTPSRKHHNPPQSSSRLSPTQQQSHHVQMINSKLSQEIKQKDDTVAQVKRIKEELMKPLINEHPLLLKHAELKHQLQHLQQQLTSIKQSPKQNLENQIEHYSQQNLFIRKQIQRQQQKLTSLQSKRLATFFPKDRENVQRMRRLMEMERELEERRDKLLEEEREEKGERSKYEEGIISQLKEENRQLQLSCDQLISQQSMLQSSTNYSTHIAEYSAMPIQQLQSLVYRQQQNKQTLQQLLTQFRGMIGQLQGENNRLRVRQQSGGYYGRESYHKRWPSQPNYNYSTQGYYGGGNRSNYNYNSPYTNDNNYNNYY